jgi:hypothetical protein
MPSLLEESHNGDVEQMDTLYLNNSEKSQQRKCCAIL